MSRLDKYENVRNVYRLLKEKGDIDKLKFEEHIKNLPFSKCSISRSLWKKIASYHQDTCSFLVSILKAEADISDVLKEQKSVQTCDLDVCELDQRLKDIDKEYEAVKSADILHLKQTFEDRLEYYKREVGEQYQVKLTQQMTEFRQNELNTIKLEMEDRFQERVKEHVMRLEKEFEIRLQSLNDQEELLKEKYNLSQQREEREAFVKRQALQAELDTIQLMKTQLDQEKLQIEREKKQMLKDHEKRETEIKKHENLLEIREKTLEGEIQEHVDRIRMEDEIKLLKQRKEIEIQSLQLSENQKMLEEKMKTFEQLKQDLIKQQNKFTEMEINDYDTIKTQNEVYKNEITNLQKQLKNAVVELEEQKQKCNLSISSDMSGESCMGVKKVQKTSDAAPLSNPQFDQWSQRLELSRRRMAQLQMVSEQFDSIYEEWKSVDLKEFLSKLNTDLPNFLTTGKSDGLTNLNELIKSDQFITFENNTQADQIMHQQTVHQESERDRNLDKEHIGSHSEINPESRYIYYFILTLLNTSLLQKTEFFSKNS
ncbi:unnamed protein product [Trichobilharzia szidati]|nr:unnamed protein product [Trichobilharzia szidati]